MSELKWLHYGGVFIERGRPWLVAKLGDKPWLCYWHKHQRSWVTQRELTETEYLCGLAKSIPPEQAEHYHKLHEEYLSKTVAACKPAERAEP